MGSSVMLPWMFKFAHYAQIRPCIVRRIQARGEDIAAGLAGQSFLMEESQVCSPEADCWHVGCLHG